MKYNIIRINCIIIKNIHNLITVLYTVYILCVGIGKFKYQVIL